MAYGCDELLKQVTYVGCTQLMKTFVGLISGVKLLKIVNRCT